MLTISKLSPSDYLCVIEPFIISEMTQETIDKFLYVSSMKLPDLINLKLELKDMREVYSDNALFVFNIDDPMTIDELEEILSETFGMVVVYRHMRSRDTDFGHSLCAFQQPGNGEMFQLNATTNGSGKINRIDVRLYDSMERMAVELRKELQRVKVAPGEFFYTITESELLSHFL